MSQQGILAYGVYLPFQRLERSSISASLGAGGRKGTRTVASYDEDDVARSRGGPAGAASPPGRRTRADRPVLRHLRPGLPEKSNAATVHATLGLDSSVVAYDLGGAVRSGVGALRAGLERAEPTLVVLSDIRTGLPGGVNEADTRYLDPKIAPRAVQWVTVDRHRYHAVGGPIARVVKNPTFDLAALPGALYDYFRGKPESKSREECLAARELIRAAYRIAHRLSHLRPRMDSVFLSSLKELGSASRKAKSAGVDKLAMASISVEPAAARKGLTR